MNEFNRLLKDAEQKFSGWDFSFISETERMRSGLLSWSYGSEARFLLSKSEAALDMGTGGGELLAKLRPFPTQIAATEGYAPNFPIAQDRLEPLGVRVHFVEDDHDLPFENEQFDLIINKHESYSPSEVKRILKQGAIFMTQQVGGLDNKQINETLGVPLNEYKEWNLQNAVKELEEYRFKILNKKEEFPIQRIYDIGALVYYLKAIPWQIPDFEVEEYEKELYQIHQLINQQGYFDVKQHRFFIKAMVE
ncbi:class I SAM-dependent methyltransferase [Alkalihalobacillus sp. 1P02AB]|uniref:class I SAM-dependent methyltransferase n=1 Tax=Alkalihalobacillus sp. 1P02AB TaxID=3132260 RepID=UPI0039A4574A